MPHPPTASRLLALTARQFTAQVPAMVAAAPWACVLFALSLPGALLLNQAGAPREMWFLLAAVVNLLALARVALAWQRQLAGVPRHAPSLDGAQARVLALVFAAIVAIAALKSISGSLTLSLYFQMPNTPGTVFLAIALLLLLILWLPVMHLLGSWSLALPQAALTDGYGGRPVADAGAAAVPVDPVRHRVPRARLSGSAGARAFNAASAGCRSAR